MMEGGPAIPITEESVLVQIGKIDITLNILRCLKPDTLILDEVGANRRYTVMDTLPLVVPCGHEITRWLAPLMYRY